MIQLLPLLNKNVNATVHIFNLNDNLLEILDFMNKNDYSQVIYELNNSFYLLTKTRISNLVNSYNKLPEVRKLQGLKLAHIVTIADERVDVVFSERDIQNTIQKLRDSLTHNSYRYKSVILKHNNKYYYFNYSDLSFLNKL